MSQISVYRLRIKDSNASLFSFFFFLPTASFFFSRLSSLMLSSKTECFGIVQNLLDFSSNKRVHFLPVHSFFSLLIKNIALTIFFKENVHYKMLAIKLRIVCCWCPRKMSHSLYCSETAPLYCFKKQ
jgi:hypothetical protein